MPNIELLQQTLQHIEDHPEEWNQHTWYTDDPELLPSGNQCGTAACFAGTAIILAGGTFEDCDSAYPPGRRDGDALHAGDLAQALLGISLLDRSVLFGPANTVEELKDFVGQLCEFGEIRHCKAFV